MDVRARPRLLRRDPDLARLVEMLSGWGRADAADDLVDWAVARDQERRSLANEALERYTELNLLYDLAEQCGSLDPSAVMLVACSELRRAVKRGATLALVIDESGQTLQPMTAEPDVDLPAGGFRVGEGIIGRVAAVGEGEIVNDPTKDRRATPAEIALGAMMAAPLRAVPRRRGVLLVVGGHGTEFTAGEFRLLSAVAALSAPVLDAALSHQRTLALAREREAELQRQLESLRDEVEQRRREERVSEITGSDYFRSLRQQADSLRSALNSEPRAAER